MAVEQPIDPNQVYYDSEQGYFTTVAIEQQLAAYRAKYPNAQVSPILAQTTTSEGEYVPINQLERIDIVQGTDRPGIFSRIQLDSSGAELGRTQFQEQGFFQSPTFGILMSAVVPVLGEYIGAALASSGALAAETATTIGNALAKISVDVAAGKDLDQAVRDVAISTAIQTGSTDVGKAIGDVIKDPTVANAVLSAGTSAIQTAASGGDASQIARAAAGGAAGSLAATESGQRVPGQVVGTLVGTGNIGAALGQAVSGAGTQAIKTAEQLAAQQAERPTTVSEAQQRLEQLAAQAPQFPAAGQPSFEQLGQALIDLAQGSGDQLALAPVAGALVGAASETAAAAAARAAIIKAMQASAETAIPAIARAAATNPAVAQAVASPAVQRLLAGLASTGIATGPLLGFVAQTPDTGDEAARLAARYPAPTTPAAQPEMGTAQAKQLADRLGVSVNQATAFLAASPELFGQLAGVEQPMFQMADIERMSLRDLRLLEADLKSPGLASAAQDFNVVKGEAFNPVIAIDASGQPVRLNQVSQKVDQKIIEKGAQPAPAPQPAAEPYVVVSVNPATNEAMVMNQAGRVEFVTVPAGTQTQSTVSLDPQTREVVSPAPAAAPATQPATAPALGATKPAVSPAQSLATAGALAPAASTAPAVAPATTAQMAAAPAAAAAPARLTTPERLAEPTLTEPTDQLAKAKPPGVPSAPGLPTIPEDKTKPGAAKDRLATLPDLGKPTDTGEPLKPVEGLASEEVAKAPEITKPKDQRMISPIVTRGPTAPRDVGAIRTPFLRSPLEQALSAYTPPGEIEYGTLGPRRDVWNEASLRLKDALGL